MFLTLRYGWTVTTAPLDDDAGEHAEPV